MKFAHKVVEYL